VRHNSANLGRVSHFQRSGIFATRSQARTRASLGLGCLVSALQAVEAGKLVAVTLALFFANVAIAKPNVVFFLVDDLGWSDVGCYGSTFHETPSIDRLAKEGVRFTDAYSTCHVCSPSPASILIGKYPARTDLTEWLGGRPERDFEKLHGAEKLMSLPDEAITGWVRSYFHPFSPQYAKTLPAKKGDYYTDKLTDAALDFIDRNKDRPFFVHLEHFAVHDPIQGRKDLVAKYEKKRAGLPPQDGPAFILEPNPDDPALSPAELKALAQDDRLALHQDKRVWWVKKRQDNAEFAGMLEATDESLGRIRAKLEELGLADNTIVISVPPILPKNDLIFVEEMRHI
jgi:arylsulfatase A